MHMSYAAVKLLSTTKQINKFNTMSFKGYADFHIGWFFLVKEILFQYSKFLEYDQRDCVLRNLLYWYPSDKSLLICQHRLT